MALSTEEVFQFEHEGFLRLPNPIFGDQEVAAFREAYDSCLQKLDSADNLQDISRPAKPGHFVHQIRAAHLQHPLFDSLIRDPRITDAVASLVAPELKIILCQGLYKPPRNGGELNWVRYFLIAASFRYPSPALADGDFLIYSTRMKPIFRPRAATTSSPRWSQRG